MRRIGDHFQREGLLASSFDTDDVRRALNAMNYSFAMPRARTTSPLNDPERSCRSADADVRASPRPTDARGHRDRALHRGSSEVVNDEVGVDLPAWSVTDRLRGAVDVAQLVD